MPDIFSRSKRSDVMSRILSRGNNATEVRLMSLFRANGIKGWRRHLRLKVKQGNSGSTKVFAVRPDFVFRRERVTVFVDGCFWHCCPTHGTRPKQNHAFWGEKLARNQARDQLVTSTLRKAGWRVIRIWECALRQEHRTLARISRALKAPVQVA